MAKELTSLLENLACIMIGMNIWQLDWP
jgi:hypothetical protein